MPSGAGVTSLSANGMNVCGTRTDGTIWCNWMTTLGGFPSADLEPIRLPGPGGAIAVLESNGYTCGLLDDRSLHCVGYVPGSPLFEPLLTPTRLPVIAG